MWQAGKTNSTLGAGWFLVAGYCMSAFGAFAAAVATGAIGAAAACAAIADFSKRTLD
jgi:hypothetical protein